MGLVLSSYYPITAQLEYDHVSTSATRAPGLINDDHSRIPCASSC